MRSVEVSTKLDELMGLRLKVRRLDYEIEVERIARSKWVMKRRGFGGFMSRY
jgi:hypothetical protein